MAAGFLERIPGYRERLEAVLDRALPSAQVYPARLHEAMRYDCSGGKRLRALLVYAAGETLQLAPERLDDAACAVELIHAYSLVHDDLPAMDDDDLRRGRPTVHKAFDEATGILVGDGLQALAFAVLAHPVTDADIPLAQRLNMLALLAEASGSRGMVGGQAVDLESEGRYLTVAELEALHIHKTGALIRACLLLAACAGDSVPEDRERLDRYGKCIGLAYQIQDDILDIEGASDQLGKTAHKDEAQLKSTYPSVMGLPAAKERATDLFNSANSALLAFGAQAEPLLTMSRLIQGRDH